MTDTEFTSPPHINGIREAFVVLSAQDTKGLKALLKQLIEWNEKNSKLYADLKSTKNLDQLLEETRGDLIKEAEDEATGIVSRAKDEAEQYLGEINKLNEKVKIAEGIIGDRENDVKIREDSISNAQADVNNRLDKLNDEEKQFQGKDNDLRNKMDKFEKKQKAVNDAWGWD